VTDNLPPGVSERAFSQAMSGFAQALGAGHVMADPAELAAEYHDPYPFYDAAQTAPSCVLRPGSVEEVQAILKVANEHRIPLWTVSQGRNHGYGGPAPRVRGSAIVELRRLNQVLGVDERSGACLIEPGVRFFDLHDHLRAGGYRLWPSVPANGWGSVVGNALERGLGATAYGEHAERVCGLEVVLASGEILRTGMGAMTGSGAWQAYRHGFGPSAEGLFMQSNFGIVTKMGMWLMPTPESFRVCEAKLAKESDLELLVQVAGELKLREVIQTQVIAHHGVEMAAVFTPRDRWLKPGERITPQVMARMLTELNLGAWNVRFALYGHDEMVEARWRIVQQAFERIAGIQLTSRKYAGDVDPAEIAAGDRIHAGIPWMSDISIVNWKGPGGAHMGFAPVAPVKAEDAMKLMAMARARCDEFGFDYMSGIGIATRHLTPITMLLFDRTDPDERRRMRGLFQALIEDAGRAGYGEYRTHIAMMDLVADQYAFGGHVQRRFNETLKDALDPNGILSPGKQGIWPRALRAGRPEIAKE
jgi:4-cresol dehydrogenase (hydroxylating)